MPDPDRTAEFGQRDLERLVEQALDEARRGGADQAEAGVARDVGLSVTVRLGQTEKLEYQRDRSMGVTVYVGRRKGTATTADLSAAAVTETVRKALSIARFTAEDPCAGLADAAAMARDIPELELSHPWRVDAQSAISIARDTEAAALAADPRIRNSDGGSVGSHEGVRVYGNSHGFLAGYPYTAHTISCVALGRDGDEMQRDFWYTSARDPAALEAAEEVGRKAARRAVARLGARKLTTRRTPVLFVAEQARALLGHFVSAIRGGPLYRRSSFLCDTVGEQLFPEWLHMTERPHLPRALGSAPFDNEGVATRDRELVRGGVLTRYVLDSYAARRLGLATTGNAGGIHNLEVGSSGEDFAALCRRLGTGLLATELMGQGVNLVTGDYSRGATGFWVEGGEIAHPVHEVTIAGNLRDIYRGIAAVGTDCDRRGRVHTGSVLVAEMTVAGD